MRPVDVVRVLMAVERAVGDPRRPARGPGRLYGLPSTRRADRQSLRMALLETHQRVRACLLSVVRGERKAARHEHEVAAARLAGWVDQTELWRRVAERRLRGAAQRLAAAETAVQAVSSPALAVRAHALARLLDWRPRNAAEMRLGFGKPREARAAQRRERSE